MTPVGLARLFFFEGQFSKGWRQPDFRQGEPPVALTGTVTAEQLTPGARYAIYRWDSVDAAFSYEPAHKIKTFTAASDTFVFEDPTTFLNNGTTYYRCVEAASASLQPSALEILRGWPEHGRDLLW